MLDRLCDTHNEVLNCGQGERPLEAGAGNTHWSSWSLSLQVFSCLWPECSLQSLSVPWPSKGQVRPRSGKKFGVSGGVLLFLKSQAGPGQDQVVNLGEWGQGADLSLCFKRKGCGLPRGLLWREMTQECGWYMDLGDLGPRPSLGNEN